MTINPLYDRNLAISSEIHIKNRKMFNRLVRREYSRLTKNNRITIRGKELADVAILCVMSTHQEIWEIRIISGAKNKKGVLSGFISEEDRAYIAEVLA